MTLSDADRNLYVRRVRFPKDLERRYQTQYFDQSLRFIRVGYFVAWLILAALTILVGFTEKLGIQNFVLLAYPAITLALSYHSSFRLIWKPYVAITVGMAVLFVFYTGTAPLENSLDYTNAVTKIPLVAVRQAIFFVMGVGIMRLPFVWTSLCLFAMELACAAIVVRFLSPNETEMSSYFFLTLFFVVFPMLGSLALERYHRADFLSNLLLEAERAKSERLLLNVLPGPIAERLKTQPEAIAESFAEVSVLFGDLVAFTPLAASMPAADLVHLLNAVFSRFDTLAEKHGLEKIKTIGDAYMIVGGLPEPHPGHVHAITEMAFDMLDVVKEFERPDGTKLGIRIGINMGPVVAGVIGTKRFLYDLWGDTVNIASRMESHGAEGIIQVTQAVRDELGEAYEFSEPCETAVKGRGMMATYRVLARRNAD